MQLSKTELYELAKQIPSQQIELKDWDYDSDGDSFVTYENDNYEIDVDNYGIIAYLNLKKTHKGSKTMSESHVEIVNLWCGDKTKVILTEKQTKTLTKAIIRELNF